MKDKVVPKLRFPEFEDDFKVKTLGELMEFKNGINAGKEQYGSGVKFINVLDILSNDYITYDRIIGRVDVVEEMVEKYAVNYGDVLFQRSSETREEVGTANVYLDEQNTAIFGGFVIRGKKIGNYNPVYLNELLKTDSVRDSITSRSGGSTRYNVGQDILASVSVRLPSIPEQTKVASFLSALDEKIQALTKKKTLLEEYKKGVMQRLFSQEIRFKDEQGQDFPDWEEKKAGYFFKNHTNKDHDGSLPILAITQENGAVLRDSIGIDIKSSESSIKSYKIVEKGDFIISLRSFQGGIEYSEVFGICSPAYTILKAKTEISSEFFKYYFKKESFISQLSNAVIGIRDGKQISFDVFSTLKLKVPSVAEQHKIANFLLVLDKKINDATQQIEAAQTYKKGLLQKMFV